MLLFVVSVVVVCLIFVIVYIVLDSSSSSTAPNTPTTPAPSTAVNQTSGCVSNWYDGTNLINGCRDNRCMLPSFKSGSPNWSWKYTDDPNDPECLRNWTYYDENNNVIQANIPNITRLRGDRNWCPVNKFVDGNGDLYSKPCVYSTDDLMKWWKEAGCTTDHPKTGDISNWQRSSLPVVKSDITSLATKKDVASGLLCYNDAFKYSPPPVIPPPPPVPKPSTPPSTSSSVPPPSSPPPAPVVYQQLETKGPDIIFIM